LFALYSNFKFPFITSWVLCVSAGGGILALWITDTPFSVSSGNRLSGPVRRLGADRGDYISYVNELRRGGTALPKPFESGDPAPASDHDDCAGGRLGLLPAALAMV